MIHNKPTGSQTIALRAFPGHRTEKGTQVGISAFVKWRRQSQELAETRRGRVHRAEHQTGDK